MTENRKTHRSRTLRGGKILLNDKGSVVDCTVRNLSPEGACLQVESVLGIPASFELQIEHEPIRGCRLAWRSGDRIGVCFDTATESPLAERPDRESSPTRTGVGGRSPGATDLSSNDLVRGELLRLRAALDQVRVGIVLLDPELRAQFINRAFRKMWRLSDTKAESKPAFVALMYHGRETLAYEMSESETDAYIEDRVAHVKSGSLAPRDVRLRSGEVLRFQSVVLPDGGRMLSYTFVTDIVKHSDELEVLRAALDNIEQGVVLLDAQLNAQFMNRAVRQLWRVSDEQAERKPPYAELVNDSRFSLAYGVPPEELDAFISRRIASVRRGDSEPVLLPVRDGRRIRSQCAVLPDGGRMLTYTDVTDFVRNAEELERLATTDSMTLCYNHRHFMALAEAEWSRFQRYNRPLSMIMFDVDHFKSINDGYGHDTGDRTLAHIAELCRGVKRSSDVFGRLGGDEFALLLPETDLVQAQVIAERLRSAVNVSGVKSGDQTVACTLSMGLAQATLSQSGPLSLLRRADEALYRAKKTGRNRIATQEAETSLYKAAAE